MDGLLLKINHDFLRVLEKRGLKVKSLKIRFLVRDIGRKGHRYVSYRSLAAYDLMASKVLNNGKYLCSAGDFPIIENLELENANLKFINEYQWYNISENRYMVKKIEYDGFREKIYNKELVRYESLMNDLINKYVSDIQNAIDIRLNSYVDPCYVDAGYVSPNSEPNDTSTLLFTTPRYTFTASFPTLSVGQNYFVNFTLGGQAPSQNYPTYGFNTVQEVLAWIQTNWGNYGYWTITPSGQLQLTTNQSTQCVLAISAVTVPELKLVAVSTLEPALDQNGNPCNKPYSSGGNVIYPNIQHEWIFRVQCLTGSVTSFLLNLSGDVVGALNKYIKTTTTGSSTISSNTITWNGTLTAGGSVDIHICGDVTLGGKADVYLGSGGYANHTPPGINTLNNQATVPVNYSSIATLVPSTNYYTTGSNNTATNTGQLTTFTWQVYQYGNGLNSSLCTGPLAGNPNRQLRSTGATANSLPILTTSTPWAKPLSVFTESLNNQFQKLGYFWCLQTNVGSKYQYVLFATYYNFTVVGSGSGIQNSAFVWEFDNTGSGTPGGSTTVNPIDEAGQATNEHIDFVYPSIGQTYRAANVSDVYFPS